MKTLGLIASAVAGVAGALWFALRHRGEDRATPVDDFTPWGRGA